MQGWFAEREWYTPYQSWQSEDPSPTIPTYRQKEEKGKKNKRLYRVGIEQLRPIKKHWSCSRLLKPTSPTPLNMGLARSFQIDTEKGIKVLLYCKVLQRGGAKVYRCATRAPLATHRATYAYGPFRALLSGCIWLHLNLYSKHRTATDWWAMSHLSTLPVRNWAPLTARFSSLRCVSAAKHHTAEQYSKMGRTKPESISQEVIHHGTLARTSSR